MKRLLAFGIVLWSTAGLFGATVVTGCVTDANGKPVTRTKVFAVPEKGTKVYVSATNKSDGCYRLRIAQDGVYGVGVRDTRFLGGGPMQTHIRVAGLDLPHIDLSTDVPNEKLLRERVTDAVVSASAGFLPLRRGVAGGDVPEILAEVPSGFQHCTLQSSNGPIGATSMWWCSVGDIREEETGEAMFKKVRDSITNALASLGYLHYSVTKPPNDPCDACVERAVWASPINGVVNLAQSRPIRPQRGHWLVLWVAYNTPLTAEGCLSLQKNAEPKVDIETYDGAVKAMRDEYTRQLNAALKGELRNLFGVAIGGPAFVHSAQQPGVAGDSAVSPNACLIKH